ncbi:MAG: hypothetical protein LBB48_08530 [Treponema sp.]|nr:hypothetical protein [Treponema sp.]
MYDKTVPEENLSELYIAGSFYFGMEPQKFLNFRGTFAGQRVDWKEDDIIKIPAGEHTLAFGYSGGGFDQSRGRSVTIISDSNLKLTYDFKPGRKYALTGYAGAGDKNISAEIIPRGFLRGFTPPSEITKFEGKWKGLGGDNDYFVFTGREFEAGGLAKGFFDFTDTALILDRKWERTAPGADWKEPPETIKAGFVKYPNNTTLVFPYQFDVDGNLVVKLQTYRKVNE